ncbi:MAG: hypothetical protein AAF612_07965, partial [Planctomycetota bacterium]
MDDPRLSPDALPDEFDGVVDFESDAASDDGPPPWEEDDAPARREPFDLGAAMLDRGLLSPAEVDNAKGVVAKTPGRRLLDLLVEAAADPHAVVEVAAERYGLPYERLDEPTEIGGKWLHKLGFDFCIKEGVIPLRQVDGRLEVGVIRPDELCILDELRHRLGCSIRPVLVAAIDIESVVEALKEEESADQEIAVDEIIGDVDEDDVEVVEDNDTEDLDLEKKAGESPVIRFVNYLIFDAVKQGASDIHIEPQEKRLQIRYRIDGVMFD